MTPEQHGQVTPARDMVPPPIALSAALRCAELPADTGTALRTEKITPSWPRSRHQEHNALFVRLAKPAGFQQRNSGAAGFAWHGSRPKIGDSWFRHPARVLASRRSAAEMPALSSATTTGDPPPAAEAAVNSLRRRSGSSVCHSA